MDNEQQRRFEKAVQRKSEEAAARSEAIRMEDNERQLDAAERPQDEASVRAKNSRHGKVTADKWNQ